MKAKELRPGDVFTVTPPDPESPVRVCLENHANEPDRVDDKANIVWGWPGVPGYWCFMGDQCEVQLVNRRS